MRHHQFLLFCGLRPHDDDNNNNDDDDDLLFVGSRTLSWGRRRRRVGVRGNEGKRGWMKKALW